MIPLAKDSVRVRKEGPMGQIEYQIILNNALMGFSIDDQDQIRSRLLRVYSSRDMIAGLMFFVIWIIVDLTMLANLVSIEMQFLIFFGTSIWTALAISLARSRRRLKNVAILEMAVSRIKVPYKVWDDRISTLKATSSYIELSRWVNRPGNPRGYLVGVMQRAFRAWTRTIEYLLEGAVLFLVINTAPLKSRKTSFRLN